MKKKKPQPNPNKSQRKEKRSPKYTITVLDDFMNEFGGDREESFMLFMDQFKKYVEETECVHLSEYLLMRNVYQRRYYEWLEKFPNAKPIHHYILNIIAWRREKKLQDHDPSTLKVTLPIYSEEWSKALDDQAKRRKTDPNEEKPTEVHVHINEDKK